MRCIHSNDMGQPESEQHYLQAEYVNHLNDMMFSDAPTISLRQFTKIYELGYQAGKQVGLTISEPKAWQYDDE